MRLSFQIALVVLIGFGAIYAGISNFYSPTNVFDQFYNVDINTYTIEARLAIETQIRLLSGMWIAAGLVIFLSVRKFESNTNVLRLVFLGLSLGAIGELLSIRALDGELQPALIKSAGQIGLCIGMELWRSYMLKRKIPDAE